MQNIFVILIFVFLSGFLGETEGLRCIDCGYHEIENEDTPSDVEIPKLFLNVYTFPFNSHPSCANGKEPDPLLSVDCSNHHHLSNAFFQTGHSGLNVKKEDYYANPDDPNTEYKCIALFMEHNETINGTIKTIKSSYRRCQENQENITDLFKVIDIVHGNNATRRAITCETDNCNGFSVDILTSKSSNLHNTEILMVFGVFIAYLLF